MYIYVNSDSDDWRKSLALCLLCDTDHRERINKWKVLKGQSRPFAYFPPTDFIRMLAACVHFRPLARTHGTGEKLIP
jgi:hypothetical protein